MRVTLSGIDQALTTGKGSPEVFALCEILPGEGFKWDAKSGLLRAEIPAEDIPAPDEVEEALKGPLIERVKAIQRRIGEG
jgi:hypothetical protein